MARKRGPDVKWVTDASGNPVIGLRVANKKDRAGRPYKQYYAKDGKNFVYFGKDDRSEAIRKFHQWKEKRAGEKVSFDEDLTTQDDKDRGVLYFGLHHDINETAYWERVAHDIRTRPKLVAQKTGIEEIGYLEKLEKPTPSVTLDKLVEIYYLRPDRPDKDKNETTNRNYWKEFKRHTGAKTVAELNADNIGHYKETIKRQWAKGKPANIRNRFGIVRTILSYGLQAGKDVERLKQVMTLVLVMLKMPKQSEPDPKPIDREDFHQLLKHADTKWKAILLLSLNMAMKPTAVTKTLKIDADLNDGIFSNDRPKTGEKRVGMLWPRTVKAIRQYLKECPHDSEHLFVNGDDRPYRDGNSLAKRYRDLRDKAGVDKSVHFEHIRDGAITYGDDGTDFIKLVAGHSAGMKGRYRKGLALKTAKVIGQIETHYFSGKKKD